MGVCRYNGKDFEQPVNADSLPGEIVSGITEAADGKIWFGTSNGPASFDGKNLTSFLNVDGKYAWIASTPDGKLWYTNENPKDSYDFGYFENGVNHPTAKLPINGYYEPLGCNFCNENNSMIVYTKTDLYDVTNHGDTPVFRTNDSIAAVQTTDQSVCYADIMDTSNFIS